MPTASLPQNPDLDQLRKQARELQRAVRQRDPGALVRASRWIPDRSDPPGFSLTAAQLVLAREHGFASWERLRRYVKVVTSRAWHPGHPVGGDESLVDHFLRLACLTYDGDSATDRLAAAELLASNPDLPGRDLCVAAACADAAAVRRHLAGGMGAAVTGGPYGWSPILYQAYARHDPQVGLKATLETTDLLLEAGADPNDGRFWHALPTPFTVLTGVLGHGEMRQPWHPHSIALARRLLEAGADPNDGQVLYNRMFGTNDDHLVLLFEFGLGRTTNGPWHRLLQESLESPQEMLRSLLAWAVSHDQRQRVRLLADHGVDILAPFTEDRSPHGYTPVELALVRGHTALAELLLSLGADPPALDPADAFVSAALSGNAEAVRATPEAVVVAVRDARRGLLTWAAAEGAPNSVSLLLAAGFDVNSMGRDDVASNDPWHTALHVAAEKGDTTLVRILLDAGADPNIVDHRFSATALDWARRFERADVAALLEPVTRDRP